MSFVCLCRAFSWCILYCLIRIYLLFVYEFTCCCVDRSSSSYAADDYSVYGNKDSDDVVYNTPSRSTSVNSPPAPAQSLSKAPSVSAPSSPAKSAVPSSSSGVGGSEYYDTYEDGKTGNVPMASNPLRNMMKKTNSNISMLFVCLLLLCGCCYSFSYITSCCLCVLF